jgi:hypothetical protein
MAVGDVVDHLAHGPAAFAVGRVELGAAEAFDCGAEMIGERAKMIDLRDAHAGHRSRRRDKGSNRKTEVVEVGHGCASRSGKSRGGADRTRLKRKER